MMFNIMLIENRVELETFLTLSLYVQRPTGHMALPNCFGGLFGRFSGCMTVKKGRNNFLKSKKKKIKN